MKVNGNGNGHVYRSFYRIIRKKIWINLGLLSVAIMLAATALIYVIKLERPFGVTPNDYIKNPLEISVDAKYALTVDMGLQIQKIEKMTVTMYTNRVEETDNAPDIGAGRMVYEGSCAVSQELFNKTVHAGDIVYVELLKKYYIVEDTMNQRYTKHIDIFTYKKNLKTAQDFGAKMSDIYVIRVTK